MVSLQIPIQINAGLLCRLVLLHFNLHELSLHLKVIRRNISVDGIICLTRHKLHLLKDNFG